MILQLSSCLLVTNVDMLLRSTLILVEKLLQWSATYGLGAGSFKSGSRSHRPICIRMFHNFTFFEIKNAWGLIRSDFGHNEKINFFFDYSLF